MTKKFLVKMSVSGYHTMVVEANSVGEILDDGVENFFDPSTIDMLQFDLDVDSIEEINDQ